MSTKPTVYIVFYSLYGHVYTLTEQVQKGLEEQGVNVKLYQVAETLSSEVLEKMHALPSRKSVPIITPDDLRNANGIIWGFPTRFGSIPAQMKAFFDSTSALWKEGALAGIPTATFFSTGGQHGGQESTAFNTIPFFAHSGMLYVPLGFANSHMFDNSEVVGSSAWGAGTVANGDKTRQVSEKEKEIAATQGKNFANLVITLQKGKAALESSNDVSAPTSKKEPAEADKTITSPEGKPPSASSTKSRNISRKDKKEKEKGVNKCFCM